MAVEIKVPPLGESISEATIAQWLKNPGDQVEEDEPLVELETEKITMEVNAPASGVLGDILQEAGAEVEVGAVIGQIDETAAGGKTAKGEKKAEESTEEKETPEKVETQEKAAKADETQEQRPVSEEAEKVEKAEAKAKAEEAGDTQAKEKAASPEDISGDTTEGTIEDITVPPLGESISEATIAKWLKAEGDEVEADEAIAELETEKITLEVNAPQAGILQNIQAKEGSTVEVGATIGQIVSSGKEKTERQAAAKPAKAEKREKSEKVSQKSKQPDASDADSEREALGETLTLDPSQVERSGEGGTITAQDLSAFVEAQTPSSAMVLSPAVARLVAELDLDARRIRGTGPKGRITKEDVLRVSEEGPDMSTVQAKPQKAEVPKEETKVKAREESKEESNGVERQRMSKLRQTVARRLKEAQDTAAMLTTFNEADLSAVQKLRGQYKESFEKKHDVKLGFSSFFVKAVVAALKELPAVNARIDGDDIVYHHYYNIGMAVSTPQGLMVPVIKNCEDKSFAEIEKSVVTLADKGRNGKLSMDDMQGGTFTITNGGVFGSLLSTPILNTPQSAILGLHKIMDRPVAIAGKVEIRPMMYLALTYDHRIIDGREAVTFLVRIKENIENPDRLLFDL